MGGSDAFPRHEQFRSSSIKGGGHARVVRRDGEGERRDFVDRWNGNEVLDIYRAAAGEIAQRQKLVGGMHSRKVVGWHLRDRVHYAHRVVRHSSENRVRAGIVVANVEI